MFIFIHRDQQIIFCGFALNGLNTFWRPYACIHLNNFNTLSH